MFDAEAMLRNFSGHHCIAVATLESLMIDIPERMQALAVAFAGGDMAVLQREAHTIKGLAGSGGAPRLRELVLEIETCCRNGLLEDVGRKLPALRAEVDSILVEWRAFLTERGS